ncbi:MAG: glycosyltransferase family 4 protein [Pseudomonadota bacterium]
MRGQDTSRWVCVFNRNRDDYQVALALHEAGLLETLVTDFYRSDSPAPWMPAALRRLHHDGLPRARVTSSLLPFLIQAAAQQLKLPMRHVFPRTDHMLAMRGARLASRRGAHLYCYGNYVPPRSARSAATLLIDFEFHPHTAMTYDALRRDAENYPQVAASFAQETRDLGRERVVEAWRSADAVVCASTMTRRSLEYAGCDPALITVIPYGCTPTETAVRRLPAGACRFLFVGQGIQRKGLHHLLLAWPALAAAGAELTLVCYRIDPGIAEMARQPGITLLGRQRRSDLDALYAAADVFVMPSIVEGFGLAYLEALAAGCHVIGTPNTGLPDLPYADFASSLVPVGDIAALAERMLYLAERKRAGLLDPDAIAGETRRWQWSDFRRAVAEHARLQVRCNAGG